jgi:hypothetical protein
MVSAAVGGSVGYEGLCFDYRIFPAKKLDSIKIEVNKENYEVKSYEKSYRSQ